MQNSEVLDSWVLDDGTIPKTPLSWILSNVMGQKFGILSPTFLPSKNTTAEVELAPTFSSELVNQIFILSNLAVLVAALFLKRRSTNTILTESILRNLRALSSKFQIFLLIEWLILTAALIYHCVFICDYGLDGNPFLTITWQELQKSNIGFKNRISAMKQGEYLLFEALFVYALTYFMTKFDCMYDSFFRPSILIGKIMSDATNIVDFYCLSHFVVYYKSGDSLVITMFLSINMIVSLFIKRMEESANPNSEANRTSFHRSMMRNFGSTILDFHMISSWVSRSPSYPIIRYVLFVLWICFICSASLVSIGIMLCWFVVSAGILIPDSLQRRNNISGFSVSGGEVLQLDTLSNPFFPQSQKESVGTKSSRELIDSPLVLESPNRTIPVNSDDNCNSFNNSCAVCRQDQRNIILLPCKCLCLCGTCREQMATYGYDRCPTCNQVVSSFIKINRP